MEGKHSREQHMTGIGTEVVIIVLLYYKLNKSDVIEVSM